MKLITLNCALSLWNFRRKSKLPYIVKALIDEKPDIIFLQEISFKSDASYIVEKLSQSGFIDSFYSDTLLIVSKHRFISQVYKRFKPHFSYNIFSTVYEVLNWLYGKGYQIVNINHDDKPIALINTHLLSTAYWHDYNLHYIARYRQLSQIQGYLKNSLPERAQLILGGDFNFDINTAAYKIIIEDYGFFDPFAQIKGNTISTQNLNRISFFVEKLNQRLDHIFIKGFKGHKTFGNIVFREPYFVNGKKLQISDHYGLALIIQ